MLFLPTKLSLSLSYLRRFGRHGYDDMKGEVCPGRAGPVFRDAAEGAVVLHAGHGQVQLGLFHRSTSTLFCGYCRRLVPLDVVVVPQVYVVHQGRTVVDHRVFIHPDDTGIGDSL